MRSTNQQPDKLEFVAKSGGVMYSGGIVNMMFDLKRVKLDVKCILSTVILTFLVPLGAVCSP